MFIIFELSKILFIIVVSFCLLSNVNAIYSDSNANLGTYEEELKKFQPSLEVEDAEEAIYNHDLTDMTDILKEMMREAKKNRD